jgi:hypothetical protein
VVIAAGAEVTSVAWNPSTHLSLLAITAGKRLLLCSPQVGDIEKLASTDDLLSDPPQQDPTVISNCIYFFYCYIHNHKLQTQFFFVLFCGLIELS